MKLELYFAFAFRPATSNSRVVSRAGLFGSGSGSGRVRVGFEPKVDKNVGLNSGLRRTFCLRCTKK